MLFCVMLVSLISILSCSGILQAYRANLRISSVAYGQTVSDAILEKITGELNAADENGFLCMLVSDDHAEDSYTSSMLGWINENDVPVYMTAAAPESIRAARSTEDGLITPGSDTDTDKVFLMHYYRRAQNDLPFSNWTFDENMYQNFRICSLQFTWVNRQRGTSDQSEEPIVIRVDLTMQSTANPDYTYTASASTCCYNVGNERMYLYTDPEDFHAKMNGSTG